MLYETTIGSSPANAARWSTSLTHAEVNSSIRVSALHNSMRPRADALPDLGSQQVAALVAPVFQDVYLFDGTITANIRLGCPDASDAELADAAAKAHVDRIVARLPDGWNTRVGEGGALLSGGERQRIAIARALLKDAPIVVLDEATAALDAENEEGVSRSIEALGRERTLIVIAHRLQTIRSADNIVVLDGHGGVADQGTHEELHARNDTYRRYWQSRRSAAGWRLTDTTTNRSKRSEVVMRAQRFVTESLPISR